MLVLLSVLLPVLATLVVLSAMSAWLRDYGHFGYRTFDPKYARISDDEFVRRCGPKTNRKIALKVRRIVSEQLGFDYDRIHPEHSFVDDLQAE